MICGSGGSKSGLANAAGAEATVLTKHEKLHAAFWREAHFQLKMLQSWRVRTTFWSSDVEKLHAAAARSTLASQNAQNTPFSDHFLKSRCKKLHAPVARRAFSSQNAQNCTPPRRQNAQSAPCSDHFWSQDAKKLHAAVARRAFSSQNVQSTCVLERFWRFRCRKGVRQKRQIDWYSASQLISQLVK